MYLIVLAYHESLTILFLLHDLIPASSVLRISRSKTVLGLTVRRKQVYRASYE